MSQLLYVSQVPRRPAPGVHLSARAPACVGGVPFTLAVPNVAPTFLSQASVRSGVRQEGSDGQRLCNPPPRLSSVKLLPKNRDLDT